MDLLGSMIRLFQTGEITKHIMITLQEIFVGTGVGIVIGLVLGYIMAKIKVIERLVMPFVVIVQTAPKISLAPLFILWMGLGIESKAALVILVVSFPIMINEVTAIRSIDDNAYNLMKVLKANRWQVFTQLEVPYSLEMLLSGIKLALTQAMTGAVIGEMIGAKAGLGYLLTLGNETYDIRLILNAVILLSMIGLILYILSGLIERKALYWKELDRSVIG
ncbi:MAG: ABC transporter permease [Chloroflexi bacterium]|jgi:NitT/TauT family transport system permease protein|nr:ABC transporter permease [Chloroflexota bacterium]